MSIRILALADSRFCQSIARHPIQSFLPGEATPKMTHKIGMALCNRILKDEYEFILSTHIDKGHVHNHIIFNNVNMVTGKCYQSNKRSYHQIRYQSDKLCKENSLSVIDKYYERFTGAKTIGQYYTEESLKERISENANQKTFTVKKRVGNIIDIANNEKAQSSKRYEFWATKHNLQVASDNCYFNA